MKKEIQLSWLFLELFVSITNNFEENVPVQKMRSVEKFELVNEESKE